MVELAKICHLSSSFFYVLIVLFLLVNKVINNFDQYWLHHRMDSASTQLGNFIALGKLFSHCSHTRFNYIEVDIVTAFCSNYLMRRIISFKTSWIDSWFQTYQWKMRFGLRHPPCHPHFPDYYHLKLACSVAKKIVGSECSTTRVRALIQAVASIRA